MARGVFGTRDPQDPTRRGIGLGFKVPPEDPPEDPQEDPPGYTPPTSAPSRIPCPVNTWRSPAPKPRLSTFWPKGLMVGTRLLHINQSRERIHPDNLSRQPQVKEETEGRDINGRAKGDG